MSTTMQATVDLEELREKAEHVEDLVTPPESVDERRSTEERHVDLPERRRVWYRRVVDAVLDLSNSMPEGIDDYDVRKLLEAVVELGQRTTADPEARDADGTVELATMRMADIARRIRRGLVREQLDDPQVAIKMVLDGLARVPVSDVARLLGVSTKTIRTWQRGNPVRQNARRVVLVADLLSYLRSSMTALGVVMWFDAERDQLKGDTPLQRLETNTDAAREPLIDLARGARAQLAG
jgi:hypothetical protein